MAKWTSWPRDSLQKEQATAVWKRKKCEKKIMYYTKSCLCFSIFGSALRLKTSFLPFLRNMRPYTLGNFTDSEFPTPSSLVTQIRSFLICHQRIIREESRHSWRLVWSSNYQCGNWITTNIFFAMKDWLHQSQASRCLPYSDSAMWSRGCARSPTTTTTASGRQRYFHQFFFFERWRGITQGICCR